MKYYHGTKSKITEFNQKGSGKHGEGYYFTPDYNEACYFAKSLYGKGEIDAPRVYTVKLKALSLFNSMSLEDAKAVALKFGFSYKEPKIVGGPKEHYHYLAKQLKSIGITNTNEAIYQAGYDGILYDLMQHVIVFDSKQVEILSEEVLDL